MSTPHIAQQTPPATTDAPEPLFDGVRAEIEQYLEPGQIEMVHRAFLFGAEAHKEQKRRSGEPYLVHPLEVADILADMRLDAVAVAAGLPDTETRGMVDALSRLEFLPPFRLQVNNRKLIQGFYTGIGAPDLRHATVWVSVIGDEGRRTESMRALGRAMPYVRDSFWSGRAFPRTSSNSRRTSRRSSTGASPAGAPVHWDPVRGGPRTTS